MQLPPAGREYARWTLTGADGATALEATIDGGTTWHPLTVDGDTVTLLVAGPAAEDNPAETVVLTAGRNHVQVRATDNPEVIIRTGGVIDVV